MLFAHDRAILAHTAPSYRPARANPVDLGV
jgi:hypothetical protein